MREYAKDLRAMSIHQLRQELDYWAREIDFALSLKHELAHQSMYFMVLDMIDEKEQKDYSQRWERKVMEKSKGYKVVLNSCFGGFGLSKKAIKMLIDKHGLDINSEHGYVDNEDFGIVDESHDAYRMDKRLISVVEELGVEEASGRFAQLRIVDVPDEVVDVYGWHIDDYDGCESVHQSHWVG